MAEENIMRQIEIEKVVLNCGGTAEKLEKSTKLLQLLVEGRKIKQSQSIKRIPAFEVRPGLKTGCMVTIRGKDKEALLKRLLEAIDKKLKRKQVQENHFSFGIKEYLEIPDIEYQRDIGMLGLEVTVVFKRKGKSVEAKKIKRGKIPKKQRVSAQEIVDYLSSKFNVEFEGKQ